MKYLLYAVLACAPLSANTVIQHADLFNDNREEMIKNALVDLEMMAWGLEAPFCRFYLYDLQLLWEEISIAEGIHFETHQKERVTLILRRMFILTKYLDEDTRKYFLQDLWNIQQNLDIIIR